MACAPHLSFLVVFFSLIIDWIICPRGICGEVFELDVVVVCGCGEVCSWVLMGGEGGGGGEGNNVLAGCTTSLMSLGAYVYMF